MIKKFVSPSLIFLLSFSLMISGCATAMLNEYVDVKLMNIPPGAQVSVPKKATSYFSLLPLFPLNLIPSRKKTHDLLSELHPIIENNEGLHLVSTPIHTFRDGSQGVTVLRNRSPVNIYVQCPNGKIGKVPMDVKFSLWFIIGNPLLAVTNSLGSLAAVSSPAVYISTLGILSMFYYIIDFSGLFGDYAWYYKEPVNLEIACISSRTKRAPTTKRQ